METPTQTAVTSAIVPVSEDGRTFTNLDGLQVRLHEAQLPFVEWIKERGYSNLYPASGTFGASELCLHMRVYGLPVICAWVNDTKTYCFVLYQDRQGEPRITEGLFHRWANGEISIS